jgi:hypothetical protein
MKNLSGWRLGAALWLCVGSANTLVRFLSDSYNTAENMGYAVATVGLPILCLVFICMSKSQTTRTILGVLSWLFLLGAINQSQNERIQSKAQVEQHVGSIMNQVVKGEAKPLSATEQNNYDDAVRTGYAHVKSAKDKFEADTSGITTDDIYTPETFANKNTISQTLDKMSKWSAANQEFLTAYGQFPNIVQQELVKSSMSAADQGKFMVGMRKTYMDSLMIEALGVQQEWAKSAVLLYSYALSHDRQIHGVNGKVIISDDATRTTFNKLLDDSQALMKKYNEMIPKANQQREEVKKQYGIQ